MKEIVEELARLANSTYVEMLRSEKRSGIARELFGMNQAYTKALHMIRDHIGDWPECSICRRKHGPHVTHAGE